MKIILTAISPSIDSEIDPRFGRGAYLLIVDTDTLQWEAHPNPGLNASGGAGIKAAQFVSDQKVVAVISGDFGPHAYNVLQVAGITMYLYGDCPIVAQAIERFKKGQLEQVGGPTRGECDSGDHGRGA
jgi:predicted Fe-Mo cluster-binding NifX family protein